MAAVLNWTQFPWEKFEELIVYLIQDVFKEPSAQRFLKQGNRQQGIDIFALQQHNGKKLSIQCKKRTNLTLSGLQAAEKEFLKGSFVKDSDTFILATVSDLQKAAIQDHFIEQQQVFRDKYNIAYQLWDVTYIENLLKKHYRLVAHYFGKQQADQYCFSAEPDIPPFPSLKDYIPRTLVNIKNIEENPFLKNKENSISIRQIIDEHLAVAKRICILADAYDGKSSLLRQAAHELTSEHGTIVPLLVLLKDTTLKPISEILREHYNAWESVGSCNLLVMIDGLDEVASDRFTEAITVIKDFVRSYPQVNLLFTCRKLFFHNFHLETELRDFEFFQLQSIGYYYLDEYLENRIGTQKKNFIKRIHQLDLSELIRNPFYLIEVTDWYLHPGKLLPKNKSEVTDRFIEKSLSVSATRRLPGGEMLDENRVVYKKALQKLAFSLQLSGLNALDKDQVQELFTRKEIQLLQNSSIVTINGSSWSFINAMFQEQLAANQLHAFSVEEIIPMISHGKQIKKISIKWIQTVASYLSQLEPESEYRRAIMAFIQQDNIELLTLADRGKFSAELRLEITKEIFDRLVRDNTRLLVVKEADIAEFIGNDAKGASFLIELLCSGITERIKAVACRILKKMQLEEAYQKALLKAVNKQMPLLSDTYYARLLLQLVSYYKLQSKKLQIEILRKSPRLDNHEFREGVYRYLIATDDIEKNYQFGIDGFEILVRYNIEINHHGSEADLEKFLLATSSAANLKKLLGLMATGSWMDFYHSNSTIRVGYAKNFANLIASLYPSDMGLLYHLVNFLICAERKHELDDFEEVFSFFEKTGTHHLAIQIYLQLTGNDGHGFYFGKMLSSRAEELLIQMHEDGEIDKGILISFKSAYYRDGTFQSGEAFRTIIEQAFGKDPESKEHRDSYGEMEKTTDENDPLHIQTQEAFEKAVREFFGFYKNKNLNKAQVFSRDVKKTKRTHLESNHLLAFIRKCWNDKHKLSLDDCLAKIATPGLFDTWRAIRVREKTDDPALRDQYIELLEGYYQQELPNALFEDIIGRPSEEIWYYKGVLLAELWQKYGFETPTEKLLDFTWIISGGINAISTAKANKKGSIAQSLLESFKDEPEKLGDKILANLRSGITNEHVETAHLEMCKVLKLSQAIPMLLERINSGEYKRPDTSHMISTYNKLGGRPEQLIPFFRQQQPFADYIYMELVRILSEDNPKEILPGMKKTLRSKTHKKEDQITAAKYLAQSGEITGFNYLIDHLASGEKPSLEIQSRFQIWQVDTGKALKKLDKVIHVIPDRSLHRDKFYRSPDRLVLEILKGLASKSEEDLQLVYLYMLKNFKKFTVDFPETASDFIWYAENMLEDFRKQAPKILSIVEIKKFAERDVNQ